MPLFYAFDFLSCCKDRASELYRPHPGKKLDDGWPESEKDVFQAALRMVVVKDSR